MTNTSGAEVKKASWFTKSEIDLAWRAATAANGAFDNIQHAKADILKTRSYVAECDETLAVARNTGNIALSQIATTSRTIFELQIEELELIMTSSEIDFETSAEVAAPYMLSPETPFDLTK